MKATAELKVQLYPTMAEAEFQQVWAATTPVLQNPALSLASLRTTLQLSGVTGVNAQDMYPASILSSVNSGS